MTTDEVLALARWPPCPVDLPESLRPAPWLHIIDVPRFISLHITRLDSASPLLRRLAERNLLRVLPVRWRACVQEPVHAAALTWLCGVHSGVTSTPQRSFTYTFHIR